jgi:hypothetical protein
MPKSRLSKITEWKDLNNRFQDKDAWKLGIYLRFTVGNHSANVDLKNK